MKIYRRMKVDEMGLQYTIDTNSRDEWEFTSLVFTGKVSGVDQFVLIMEKTLLQK